jgi:hypothetical protein
MATTDSGLSYIEDIVFKQSMHNLQIVPYKHCNFRIIQMTRLAWLVGTD